jgi:hypothetical protein
MKSKSKLRTIKDAFTSEIPTEENFFKERMKICEGCEFNSENVEPEKLSVTQNIQIKNICAFKRMCTACGCCLDEKVGQKNQACGLKEKGLEPKWEALKADTSSANDLDVEILNKTAKTVQLDIRKQYFAVGLGDELSGVIPIELMISREAGLRISSIKPGCQCTVSEQEQISDTEVKLKLKVDTKNFNKGTRFEKPVTVNYFKTSNGVNAVVIKLIGKKK